MNDAKRSLKVNLEDLKGAFDNGFDELSYYLDLETGKVIMVNDETRQQLKELLETTEAETIDAADKVIQEADTMDWEKDLLSLAASVEFGDDSRFIEIPPADSRDGYEDMEAFIETVSDGRLQELLKVAIQGQGAFRRFKDVLARDMQEREKWFRFRDERLQQRMLDWLDMENINPIL